MPRWASRIDLEVVNVRVERLQEISEEDAKAEGVGDDPKTMLDWAEHFGAKEIARDMKAMGGKGASFYNFQKLWCDINGPESWNANPWV